MLLGEFEGFSDARSRADLHSKLLEVTHWLDHERYGLVVSETDSSGEARFAALSNTPADWAERFTDTKLAMADPVHTHLRTSLKPIVWTQDDYTKAGAGEMWEVGAPYGYKTGIAITYPLGPGRKLLIGIDRGTVRPSATETVTTIGALQLLAAYAQSSEAIQSMFPSRHVTLAPQQQKVMSLVAAGKSNSVIAEIMGISKDTVAHHVKAVFQKLNVSTRQQAVLEIARLNLIPQKLVT